MFAKSKSLEYTSNHRHKTKWPVILWVQDISSKTLHYSFFLQDHPALVPTSTKYEYFCVCPKVPYFFFPGKVCFCPLFGKNGVSEWKCCFFFRPCLFFRLLKSSEWVRCKIFQKKKHFRKKKKTHVKSQNRKIPHIFYWFYDGKFPKIEWVESNLFLWRKKKTFFFPPAGKKIKFLKFE